MNNITKGLIEEGHSVRVLAVETAKHPVNKDLIKQTYLELTAFDSVYIDTSLSVWAALKSFFSRNAYQVNRFYSKTFAHKLIEVLQSDHYDIVHLESIFMSPYIDTIRLHSSAKIVLRIHNVEHQIWNRVAKNETNPFRRLAIKSLANQLERYECALGNKLDGFVTISQPDFDFFEKSYRQVPGAVVPFGVNLDDYPENENYIPSENPELFHVGSMNWMPNIEGIIWFLDEVWPLIVDKFPQISFTIAGRSIPKEISQRADTNVIIAGEVPSASDFMLEKDIMVVPLLSGSGIRVKIIEGMALGKTIITTSIGAEGLDVEDGKNILIANTPEEFVSAVTKCVNTPDLCAILGENARNFVALNHNNRLVTRELINFYNTIL